MTTEEYNQLFNDIKKKEENNFGVSENHIQQNQENNQNNWQQLNETPNYNQNNWQQLNETPKSNYNINENLNDGWDNNFQVETKVNGINVDQNQNQNQMINARMNHKKDNLNGLNQFVDDDSLNEVYQTQPQIPQVNEKTEDQDVVSVELFERMNQNAMLSVSRLF